MKITNEILLALRKKITEKFGREIKNHRDAFDLNGELNDGKEKDVIHINTIKRLFGFKGYDDCKNLFTRKPEKQEAIAKYLGCGSWEILMCELEILAYPKETAQELAKLRKNKPSK